MSTAHTDEDLHAIVRAFKEAALAFREGGFLPPHDGPPGGVPARAPDPEETRITAVLTGDFPVTAQQREVWLACLLGREASCAYNLSYTLNLKGALRLEALQKALQTVVERHESLRMTFSPMGENLPGHTKT